MLVILLVKSPLLELRGGKFVYKEIVVEKDKHKNDESLKPNYKVVLGSISFSSKLLVTWPCLSPKIV